MMAQAKSKGRTVIVGDDENATSGANTFTVYAFNQSSGAITVTQTLSTGGTGTGGGFYAENPGAANQHGKCLFLMDEGSSDISVWSGSPGSYVKVGNYSNGAASFGLGSIQVAKDGKAVYTANSYSSNLSTWIVASDCSLTYGTTITPSAGADLYGDGFTITRDGKFLVANAIDLGDEVLFAVNPDDTLTDLGFAHCSCVPTGTAITGDDKVSVVADLAQAPGVVTFALSSSGISYTGAFSLANSSGVSDIQDVELGSACIKGTSCNMFTGGISPGGAVCAAFTESPLAITVTSATSGPSNGQVAKLGNWLVADNYPSTFEVAPITYKPSRLGVSPRRLHQMPKA